MTNRPDARTFDFETAVDQYRRTVELRDAQATDMGRALTTKP